LLQRVELVLASSRILLDLLGLVVFVVVSASGRGPSRGRDFRAWRSRDRSFWREFGLIGTLITKLTQAELVERPANIRPVFGSNLGRGSAWPCHCAHEHL